MYVPFPDLTGAQRSMLGDLAGGLPSGSVPGQRDNSTGMRLDRIEPSLYGAAPPPLSAPYAAAGGTPNGFTDAMGSLLAQVGSLLAQLAGLLGASAPGPGGLPGAKGSGAERVENGTFSSWGDPHLTEDATLDDGSRAAQHFDSMAAHADLLDTPDVHGGLRISTDVTAPNAEGITKNARATIWLDAGRDAISMRNDGSVTVTDEGRTLMLRADTPVGLGDGTSVTLGADGSFAVHAQNDDGGSIDTILRVDGGGVDVAATVHELSVGGDIVAGNAAGTPPDRRHLDGGASAYA